MSMILWQSAGGGGGGGGGGGVCKHRRNLQLLIAAVNRNPRQATYISCGDSSGKLNIRRGDRATIDESTWP